MTNLLPLRRLTKELSEEIEYDEHGKIWKLITFILDNVGSPAAIINKKHALLYINKNCRERFKELGFDGEKYIGKNIKGSKFCESLLSACDECPIQKTLDTKEVHTLDFTSKISNINYKMICIPLIFDGVSGVLAILSEKNGK